MKNTIHIALIGTTVLCSMISIFFVLREKAWIEKLRESERRISYYAGLTLSSQPSYRIEATILDFDPTSSEITLAARSRWFPSDELVQIKLPLARDAVLVSRVGIMDTDGVITDIEERTLHSPLEMRLGSFAFITILGEYAGTDANARITSIILGEKATP